MHCKLIHIIVVVLYPLLISSQSLILDKINDLEIKPGFSAVEQIVPLPNKQIAVSYVTSYFDFDGEFQNLSMLGKDTVKHLLETYYHNYEFWLTQLSDNQRTLLSLNYDIISNDKQACLYTYNLSNGNLDSLNIPVGFNYKNVMIDQNEIVFFGKSEDNDSLLLQQTFDINNKILKSIWILDTIPKSLWWGYKQNNQSYFALSTPTYGSSNPPISTNYLIYSSNEDYKQIEFNSSNEEHSTLRPVTYVNPIFPVNDSIVYLTYDARKPFQGDYNYIVASYNIKQSKLNWQYQGLDRHLFYYVNASPKGVHLCYQGSGDVLRYEFINSEGERVFEDDNSELVRYCTQNDECFVYRNDTLFLKRFGKVLAHFAFENPDQYVMGSFHPDDEHHYVTLRKKGNDSKMVGIYQLKLDTLDTGVFNPSTAGKFSLYPNPASNTVHLLLPLFQEYVLEIINVNGQVVEKYNFSGQSTNIQPSNLTQGSYWLQAIGKDKKRYVSRLIWLE